MICDDLVHLMGLLFWGLPFLAYFWLRRRRQVAGVSLTLGRVVITLWVLTFPVQVLSLFLGFSKLEGNYSDGCGSAFTIFAVLVAAYAALLYTWNAKPKGSDGANNDA
jgi:hypothetical protein